MTLLEIARERLTKSPLKAFLNIENEVSFNNYSEETLDDDIKHDLGITYETQAPKL